MTTDLYNQKNEKIGTVELPERIFGAKWNADLVHQVLIAQMANSRKPVAHAKGRSEVSGGGKKPWRQKGTGRARHGSIRSPLWKGGGVSHGPVKEKSYKVKVNKKMSQSAIFSVLSKRLKKGEIKVIDSLNFTEPKTKLISKFLNFFLEGKRLNALLIPSEKNKNIYRASRNIQNVKSLDPKSVNMVDLLKYKKIILDKESIAVIDKHYHEVK
jgi:large subunit ribosomal protein L4